MNEIVMNTPAIGIAKDYRPKKKDKGMKAKVSGRNVKIGVVTYEQAKELGMSSSFLRTVSRSLERLAKDCQKRIDKEDFESRWPEGEKETKHSLTEAKIINLANAYEIRTLAARLKKEGL